MSGEIVLELNIVVGLFSIFINKNSLEVVSEKACVGGQVKLEISEEEKEEAETCYLC